MASVLLVEDELLIRMMIAEMLVDLNHSVAGKAGDLAEGQRLAATLKPDLAMLDIKLGKDSSEAIATTLAERGIPFLFASGYGADGVPPAFKDRPCLIKPFKDDELQACLTSLLKASK